MEKIDAKDNFIRLIHQYQNLIFSICLKLAGDYFVAEDLAQETFVTAYQHWQELGLGIELLLSNFSEKRIVYDKGAVVLLIIMIFFAIGMAVADICIEATELYMINGFM